MRLVTLLATAFTLALGLVALPAAAEQDNADEAADGRNCIPLNRINGVEVLDRQRIVFRMTGRDHYLNTLPHACPSLRRNQPIMYRTSLSVLCNVDSIRVLENFGGGYYPGASCGLGEFSPITDDEIKALRAEIRESR